MYAASQAQTVLNNEKSSIIRYIRQQLKESDILSNIAEAVGKELRAQLNKEKETYKFTDETIDRMVSNVVSAIKTGQPDDPHVLHGLSAELRNQLETLLVGSDGKPGLIGQIFSAIIAAFNAYDSACALGHKSVTGAPGSITPIIVT